MSNNIIIYAEYCHDFSERFSPIVSRIKEHFGTCRVVGVFSLFEKSVEDNPVTGPFDELYFLPVPTAAALFVKNISCIELLVFIDHNHSMRDQLLYQSLKKIECKFSILFRNIVSLSSYLASGNDDRRLITSRLAQSRSNFVSVRVKIHILAFFTGLFVKAGKMAHLVVLAGATRRQQILFMRLDLLGDMIVALPYLAALKRRYPDAELSVMASTKGAAILRGMAAQFEGRLYDRLYVWDAPWHKEIPSSLGLRAVAQILIILPQLWRRSFDIIIQPVNFGTGIVFALLCLGKRVVAPIDLALPLSMAVRKHVSDPVEVPRNKIAHMKDFLDLVVAKVGVQRDALLPVFQIEEKTYERVRELLNTQKKNGNKTLILVNVGAGNRARCWGSDKFGKLILKLLEQGEYCVALTGTADEMVMADEVQGITGCSVINTAGQLSLNDLVALTSLTDLVITADTSVMHIADALAKPVVAIFGPGLVEYCKPLIPRASIVKSEFGCSGCRDLCFTDEMPSPCLKAVTVESVFAAAMSMLQRTASD